MQGSIDSTALHCAVNARRNKCVALLLEAGADPSIADYTASTPLYQAVGIGHYPYVVTTCYCYGRYGYTKVFLYCNRSTERMLMFFPEHSNLQKADDGYSLLHTAVVNGHLSIVDLIAQQVHICA